MKLIDVAPNSYFFFENCLFYKTEIIEDNRNVCISMAGDSFSNSP